MRRGWRIAAATLLLAANGPHLAGLQPGRYVLERDGGPTREICVGELRPLLQAAHGPGACRFFRSVHGADRVRAAYECANGSGVVELISRTPRVADISASGIRQGQPYKVRITARRTGTCTR